MFRRVSRLLEAGRSKKISESADRNTAAVFHLMRVLEAGVKEFANKLGATFGAKDPWGPILVAVDKSISVLPQSIQQEREFRQICKGLSTGLNGIRDAWRNPTMHEIASSYQKGEALDIWNLSATFMRRLAKIV